MITERNKSTFDDALESHTFGDVKPMNNFRISCLKFLYLLYSLVSDSGAGRVFILHYGGLKETSVDLFNL